MVLLSLIDGWTNNEVKRMSTHEEPWVWRAACTPTHSSQLVAAMRTIRDGRQGLLSDITQDEAHEQVRHYLGFIMLINRRHSGAAWRTALRGWHIGWCAPVLGVTT